MLQPPPLSCLQVCVHTHARIHKQEINTEAELTNSLMELNSKPTPKLAPFTTTPPTATSRSSCAEILKNQCSGACAIYTLCREYSSKCLPHGSPRWPLRLHLRGGSEGERRGSHRAPASGKRSKHTCARVIRLRVCAGGEGGGGDAEALRTGAKCRHSLYTKRGLGLQVSGFGFRV